MANNNRHISIISFVFITFINITPEIIKTIKIGIITAKCLVCFNILRNLTS